MHELALADSARQAPVSILRLRMLPYSIGHELLLLQQRNPLLFIEEEFNKLETKSQISAIMRATLICYRTWKQNQKEDRAKFWGWWIRKSDWPVEIAEFRNYRAAGSVFPPVPTAEASKISNGEDEGGREFGGPHLARLLAYASRGALYAALDFETPYDVPMGLANFLYLSEMEQEGSARIENRKEFQVREEMDGHRKAIAAEKAKIKEGECQP